jgi:hypothetical protein
LLNEVLQLNPGFEQTKESKGVGEEVIFEVSDHTLRCTLSSSDCWWSLLGTFKQRTWREFIRKVEDLAERLNGKARREIEKRHC